MCKGEKKRNLSPVSERMVSEKQIVKIREKIDSGQEYITFTGIDSLRPTAKKYLNDSNYFRDVKGSRGIREQGVLSSEMRVGS